MKTTGELEGSFPAFDDLFEEEPAELEANLSPAIEEKVEDKILIKEIGQNSEEWKDAFSISENVPGKVAGFCSLHNRLSGFFFAGELPLQLLQGKR